METAHRGRSAEADERHVENLAASVIEGYVAPRNCFADRVGANEVGTLFSVTGPARYESACVRQLDRFRNRRDPP